MYSDVMIPVFITDFPPAGGSGPPNQEGPTPIQGATISEPVTSAQSYSEKVKLNVNRSQRLKRKVLEINLDVDVGVKLKLETKDVARTLSKIGIDAKSQMEGFQICPGNSRKIFVWLKDECDILRFCRDDSYKVTDGVKTALIKPMDKNEVSVLVKGLNFNTPDTLVKEYLNKHGKVISEKVIYEVESDGDFKGLKNGNRKYLVDFSNGRNTGSFHIIDGANVQIFYQDS